MIYTNSSGTFEIYKNPSNEQWNKGNTEYTLNNNMVYKTIYDPCPVSYSIPRSGVFTKFTSAGQDTSNSSEFNTAGSFNKGWNFYTGGWKTGNTIFLFALGARSSILAGVGTCGNYFISTRYSASEVRQLYFESNRIAPTDHYYSASSRNILPAIY